LGGPNGVRAYPQSEASGDSAHLINLELRRSLQPVAQVAMDIMLFADFGVSRLVQDVWAGYTGEKMRHLSAIGLGVALNGKSDWTLRADYALRLGSELAQSEPDSRGRFWVQASKLF
jgi:hemolysin activation/secretion protein